MNFTFGIITSGNDVFVNKIIDSIENENIPNYEIVIVGGNRIDRKNVNHFPFVENTRGWITRKKNIITQHAKYDNIVYMHDYVRLVEGWYNGFLEFGDDFKICMNRIINQDGTRYRDWTLWYRDLNKAISEDVSDLDIYKIVKTAEVIIPYDIKHLSKYMYISGTYWVAKKDVMKEFPLDERFHWGAGEDIEWSSRVRQKYNFSINSFSSVQFLKYKEPVWHETTDTIEILKKMK